MHGSSFDPPQQNRPTGPVTSPRGAAPGERTAAPDSSNGQYDPPHSRNPGERLNGHYQSSPSQGPDEVRARAAFAQARGGQRSAYGLVVRLYQHRLFNAVYRMVGDREDAAEITQEAFTRGFEKIEEFRGDSGPYTWLFRIAMNAAVSRIRRSARRKTASLDATDSGGYATSYGGSRRGRLADAIPSGQPTPSDAAQMSEEHRAVVAALGRLDSEYRALLVMRDLEGFDYRQMADVLGLPLGTLKSRLFRARVALRELLQDRFGQEDQRAAPARPLRNPPAPP